MSGPIVGVQTQLSAVPETTYGTPVTTDRWHEFVSESLKRKNRVLQSNGLRGITRNLRRGSRRVLTGRDAAGAIKLEVATTTMGRIFNQILGGSATVVQQGGTPAYLHTYAMGSVLGKSMTWQKVLRDASGTVIQTLTYPGTKIIKAEFSITVDGILELTLTVDCRDERTDIAAASASYTTTKLFHFAQATLSVNGSSAANVKNAKVAVENPANVDRRYLGNAGLKSEPTDSDFPAVTGSFDAEVLDATLYNLFAADGGGTLVLQFTGAVISGIYSEQLTITVPEIHLTGESPAVSGPGVVEETLPFEAAYDGTNPGMTITYMTTDTAS